MRVMLGSSERSSKNGKNNALILSSDRIVCLCVRGKLGFLFRRVNDQYGGRSWAKEAEAIV